MNRSATLALRHSDIYTDNTITASNAVGEWWAGRQHTTWRVDLRRCLGDIWKPGQVYALRLNQYGHGAIDFYIDPLNAFVHFKISGLDWASCSYDAATNNNEQYANLMTREILETQETQDLPPNVAVLFFKASSIETARITIELVRASDNAPAQYEVNPFPSSYYNFTITPVE